jgi:uncharacterized hydrophobic protein (TIGR00271 family)
VVSPAESTAELLERLERLDGVLNVWSTLGSVHQPDGDAVEFDVVGGAANHVVRLLHRLEVPERGSVAIDPVDTTLSGAAQQATRHESRWGEYAPIWAEVESRVRREGTYLPSWYVLLVIAGLIASIGIFTNSQILVVAAMVVGPEYAAVVSGAYAITRRDGRRLRAALAALTVGFVLAIAASLLFGLLVRAFDLEPGAFAHGVRPVSGLIDSPDFFSVVVASLAAVVGIVSLTESRASTLIGVFISVTTIPAAADIGVSSAFGSWGEARGSLVQLLVNLALLLVIGAVTLVVQRRVWDRVEQRTDQAGEAGEPDG